MKKAVLVANAQHQGLWATAFAEGLRKHGWQTQICRSPTLCDLLVLWGVRRPAVIKMQTLKKGQICILERGYVGDRFKWTSVSFGGGLNNRGIFRGPFHDGSRWEKHFGHLMKPWKGLTGGSALILGQVPTDMSVKGVDLPAFHKRAAAEFAARGFSVKFRPHPMALRERCEGATRATGELADALAEAAVTISWNSNASVDAVLAGVPSVTMDEGAMAWDVTGHELKFPTMPDRTNWAHWLAWTQWQLSELSSGECWAHVGMLDNWMQQAS